MLVSFAHVFLMVISVGALGSLVWFKPRRVEHYLFAVLAFSLFLLALSNLLPGSFSVEQQVIALGTFATCNVFWLLSRCLFRKGKALRSAHFMLAGAIALLILLSRGIDIFVTLQWIDQQTLVWLKRSLTEMLRLLSSGVLVLSFWEIVRGYSSSSRYVQKQKALLASTMFIAVISTRVIVPSIPLSPETSHWIYIMVRSVMASAILISILSVLWLQHQNREALGLNSGPKEGGINADGELLTSIYLLMEEKKLYLQADLKLVDIATELGVPEYRVSRALKEKTDFDNFNHFVNHFRLNHAKFLLTDENSKNWTILVISMESGFSSLATFNRVFKHQEKCTPNAFRKMGGSVPTHATVGSN